MARHLAAVNPDGWGWCALTAAILAAWLAIAGCGRPPSMSQEDFVGKWKSSKLLTPLHLHRDGSWEIRTDDGAVLQYGVWEYRDNAVLWSARIDEQITYDNTPVVSGNQREFRLRERDGTIATFVRLD